MSVNEVLARVGEIRARMELAPMRALAPVPAAVATVSIRAPGTWHTTLTWGQRWRLRPSNTSGRPTWPEETVLRQGGIARR